MPFDDNELKRLKEIRNGINDGWPMSILPRELDALLSRLEAAENALNNRHIRGIFDVALEKWRKEAGK